MKDNAYVIKDCFNYTKEDLIPVRGKVQESPSSDGGSNKARNKAACNIERPTKIT